MTMDLHNGNLLSPPAPQDMITLAPEFGTRFMLFVDTEEEFDWGLPFDRAACSVTALSGMAKGQSFFATSGVKPIYVTDYPVVNSDAASAMMALWLADGAADIGTHLHPWVSPPHVEKVTAANSYAGFLPEELERAKLEILTQRLEERFGQRPIVYRAGRYGVGPNSARLLEEQGYLLDSSVRSRYDYRHQHGPDFRSLPIYPYWIGPNRSIVELPLSTAFIGTLGRGGSSIYNLTQYISPLSSLLSRTRMLSRVPLTPEGVPAAEACLAIDALLQEGARVINLSFHSPTLEIGNTPYVRNEADLLSFYRWWDVVLTHLAKRGVASATLNQFLDAIPKRREACKAA